VLEIDSNSSSLCAHNNEAIVLVCCCCSASSPEPISVGSCPTRASTKAVAAEDIKDDIKDRHDDLMKGMSQEVAPYSVGLNVPLR
jgi:hypothetical protein